MGILKTLTLSHKRAANGNYSILLQKNPPINQPCLIFEAGTVVALSPDEAQDVARNGGYVKFRDGYACLGMIQYAYEGSKEILFLVIVTDCRSEGKVLNSELYRITDVSFISMRNAEDQNLVHDVKRLLASGSFYFAHSSVPGQQPYDITLNAQRAHMTATTDNRFFWNRLLHRHFERFGIDTSAWLVKSLCGGINIKTVYIGGLQAKACLISRLSCERAGTRFHVRGVNDLGHVANFVETEQVIFINQTILSFILIRGSIPLFWEQPGVQVGSHRIKMSRGSEISQAAYDKHMFLLKERFEDVVLINLLSVQESELLLNQLFNAHHKLSRIGSEFPFINFDFHTLCRQGQTSNLDALFSCELKTYCDRFGYFHSERGELLQIQKGVFRVNCLDCLDRTNRMQKYLGLRMLAAVVQSIDRVDIGKVLPRLQDVYDTLWVQNGDEISRIYAGTGALEGKNFIVDGTLSVARTIQNNLLDGSKQGAIDILILGRTMFRDFSYRAASLLPHYFMYASPSILVNMCDRYLDYCTQEPIKVAVATWNVNGGKHFDNTSFSRARPLSDWLVDYWSNVERLPGQANLLDTTKASDDPIDIYAIGFQEIVDLNAGNIVAASTQNQKDWLTQIQKTISRNYQYWLVSSGQLVGVCLFVFARSELAPYIKDVCMDQVKTGMGGATGNKGGIAIRLRYKATSLCFVCAHFAAGQSQVKERDDDYAEITRRIQFPMGRSINSHDYVFWCGDFNYRLSKISNDEVRYAASVGDYALLLQHDQLKQSQAAGSAFKGYIEGDIDFAPTYKYDTHSNDYDSSEKCRVPAYTDRVLFKKRNATRFEEDLNNPKQVRFYNRIELMSSDHRPVIGEFDIEVIDVDKKARALVLDSVLDGAGPPDCTVFVRVDGHLDVTDDDVFAAILRLLADQAGEILLVRYVDACLMVIFSDGKSTVKAMALDGCPLGGDLPDNKLIITLRTSNWHQVIHAELINNMDNTVNLVSGQGPSVHLEDDEDEKAQELNMSIGPEVNADAMCLTPDLLIGHPDCVTGGGQSLAIQSSGTSNQSQIPPQPPRPNPPSSMPPKSPLHIPSRPPPPPPAAHKRKLPPEPTSSSSPSDPFGFDPQLTGGDIAGLPNDFDQLNSDQSSINLMELSIASDPDEAARLPPPTMAPPALPPSTPNRTRTANLVRPTRAAPPPPVPTRNKDTYEAPRDEFSEHSSTSSQI